jgi:hypothetical protein
MLRYAYAPAEDRGLALRSGDFFREGLHSDLLVISAWDRYYEPVAGTMIAALRRCGITVGALSRALDFTGCDSIRGWVSEELDTPEAPIAWPQGSTTRFRRLAVIESPRPQPDRPGDAAAGETIPVFEKMFRLLALLPLHQVPCQSVATPLLNAGQQQARLQQLIPGLIQGVRVGFENVPELKELVIFDIKEQAIDDLREAMLVHFHSTPKASELRPNAEQRIQFREIAEKLQSFKERPDTSETAKTIAQDILAELDDKQKKVNLVAIGISARKLIEYLVGARTRGMSSEVNLFRRINYLEGSINPWTINALHTVRIFGNWMGHAEFQHFEERDQPPPRISIYHLMAMLLALRCVVAEPWWKKEKLAIPIKRSRPAAAVLPRPKRAAD